MSKADAEDQLPALESEADVTIALVVDSRSCADMATVLEREQLVFSSFDGPGALLARTGGTDPSVIVLWLEDTTSGLAGCIEPLTQAFARSPVIVACSTIERWGVRAALTAGAAGVVLGKDLDTALVPSVRAVLAGQTCVPREHWRQVEPPALSSREKQILGLVVMGFANGQIAGQLFLAESTVKS